jgi:hypothetical protein
MYNIIESKKVPVNSIKVGDVLILKKFVTNAKAISYCYKLSCVCSINSESDNDG